MSSAWTPSWIRSGRRSRSSLAIRLRRGSFAGSIPRRLVRSARRSRSRSKPLGRGLDPRIGPLTEYDSGPRAARLARAAVGRKVIGRNRRASAVATAGCTSAITSPPKRATSRTRLELR